MCPSLMGRHLSLESAVIDDVAEVITIAIVFPLSVVLSYLPMHVVVGQASIAADRGCCFTLGMFCPIGCQRRDLPDDYQSTTLLL
jgi:hypothetical protein